MELKSDWELSNCLEGIKLVLLKMNFEIIFVFKFIQNLKFLRVFTEKGLFIVIQVISRRCLPVVMIYVKYLICVFDV